MAAFAAGDPLASPPRVNHLYPLGTGKCPLDDLVTSILVLLSLTIYRPRVFQCEDEERALVASSLRSTTALPRCVFILSVHRTRGANPS